MLDSCPVCGGELGPLVRHSGNAELCLKVFLTGIIIRRCYLSPPHQGLLYERDSPGEEVQGLLYCVPGNTLHCYLLTILHTTFLATRGMYCEHWRLSVSVRG